MSVGVFYPRYRHFTPSSLYVPSDILNVSDDVFLYVPENKFSHPIL